MSTLTDRLDALAAEYHDTRITLSNANSELRLLVYEAARIALQETREDQEHVMEVGNG